MFEKIKIKRRMKWHSKTKFLKVYEYIDEMLAGPFKKWRHLHKFHNIDGKQTDIINEIEFELPYGILGKLFEVYAYKQLKNTFEYRKIATVRAQTITDIYIKILLWTKPVSFLQISIL
jgi:ligand-binding SRPBCC domain-containing protein